MTHVPGAFTLLHEDEALLVLDKPAGLLCVPGRGPDKEDALSARVQAAFPDARIVHRLDMATSGLVLMARGIQMQRALGAAFEARAVAKTYVALVCGPAESVPNEWQTIDLPLNADWPNRPRQVVDHAQGKPSQTRWRRAREDGSPTHIGPACTRVELEPLTGRTHQLRVHLAAVGHAIWGDSLYAPGPVAGGVDRLMLHATQLSLAHPASGAMLHFDSLAPF